jgi:glycosyltransferase involved in cell wall biosynthesis
MGLWDAAETAGTAGCTAGCNVLNCLHEALLMRIAFLTGTPLDIARGSGTYTGITTLARGIEALGHSVTFFTPRVHLPVFTAERLLFNERLRRMNFEAFDAIAGFDMDGYRVRAPHVAAIKGVIADEMRFERGATRFTMAVQARCERAHVQRAARVITTSAYSASRIRELYGRDATIVPECIDLARWTRMLPAPSRRERFTVLCVCRFYPRKRVDVLLRAAALMGKDIEVRIVGGGPEERRLRALSGSLGLGDRVRWLGTIPDEALAREYAGCDAFCLPSVQEGFGIVFLEAMAAGKPIVAARAAAVPEVVREGLLVEPESAEAIASALDRLRRSPELRASIAEAGRRAVAEWDAPRVAARFLEAIGRRDASTAISACGDESSR